MCPTTLQAETSRKNNSGGLIDTNPIGVSHVFCVCDPRSDKQLCAISRSVWVHEERHSYSQGKLLAGDFRKARPMSSANHDVSCGCCLPVSFKRPQSFATCFDCVQILAYVFVPFFQTHIKSVRMSCFCSFPFFVHTTV